MTLRAIQLTIQPAIVDDDGTNLTPVSTAPIVVSAADLAEFPERFFAELAERNAAAN